MLFFQLALALTVLIFGIILAVVAILQLIDDIKNRRWRKLLGSSCLVWATVATVIVGSAFLIDALLRLAP